MKRHILFINDRLHSGGVELVLQNLLAYLNTPENSLSIWAPEGDRETLRKKYSNRIHWSRLPFWYGPSRRFSPKWFFQRVSRLLFEDFLLKLRRWDAVVAFKEGPSMRVASKLRARKKLAWIHTDYEHFYWSGCNFRSPEDELRCMKRFDHLVCVSDATRLSVKNTLGDPGNMLTCYNPINSAAVLRAAALPAEDCIRPEGKPLFVSVGRLSEVKRYDMLIEICAELAQDFDFELWIIGGGELEKNLRSRLECTGLNCIRLLGCRDNPYPYIAQADWLISSSRSESYGITIQEALLLGVPVLASYCPAIEESLDPRFGILAGQDSVSLAAAIREVLVHPELGENYRREIRAHYDRESLWQPRLEKIKALLFDEKEKTL